MTSADPRAPVLAPEPLLFFWAESVVSPRPSRSQFLLLGVKRAIIGRRTDPEMIRLKVIMTAAEPSVAFVAVFIRLIRITVPYAAV